MPFRKKTMVSSLRTLYSFIHHLWDPFWCREIIKIKESLIKLVCCPMCHFGALSRGGARERESKTLFVFPLYFSPASSPPHFLHVIIPFFFFFFHPPRFQYPGESFAGKEEVWVEGEKSLAPFYLTPPPSSKQGGGVHFRRLA